MIQRIGFRRIFDDLDRNIDTNPAFDIYFVAVNFSQHQMVGNKRGDISLMLKKLHLKSTNWRVLTP